MTHYAIPRRSVNGGFQLNSVGNTQETGAARVDIRVNNREKAKSIFSRIWNWVVKFFGFIRPGAGQDFVDPRNTRFVSVVVPSPEDSRDDGEERSPPLENLAVINEEVTVSTFASDTLIAQNVDTPSQVCSSENVEEIEEVEEGRTLRAAPISTSSQAPEADDVQPLKKKKTWTEKFVKILEHPLLYVKKNRGVLMDNKDSRSKKSSRV